MFDLLTLSALVEEEVFVVHGGLSPYIQSIHQIRDIDRTSDNGGISFHHQFFGALTSTKVQWPIYYGPIQMIEMVGESRVGEQVIRLAKISAFVLTKKTV